MDGWNTRFLLGFGPFSGAMLVAGRVHYTIIHISGQIIATSQDQKKTRLGVEERKSPVMSEKSRLVKYF